MKPDICEKLDIIDDLFTPERLVKSKERWRRLWNDEPVLDRYPFVYAPINVNYYAPAMNPEERLRVMLDEIILRGTIQDDFIPAFFPGCRQATIPNMFGAPEIKVGTSYDCERIIFEADDVYRLPSLSMGEGTIANEWIAMQAYVMRETDNRLPIHVTDMQGPVDVCGQMWGYDNLLAAAYTDPDEYHYLLEKVATAFNFFWQSQKFMAGKLFVGTHLFGWDWVPEGMGATVSADSLVMVSSNFYQEFFQPYLEQISEYCGGITVHSCGDFSATIPALLKTKGIRGINAGQMTLAQLVNAGATKKVVIIAWANDGNIEETFQLIREHNLRVSLTIGNYWPWENGTPKPMSAWSADEREMFDGQFEKVLSLATNV